MIKFKFSIFILFLFIIACNKTNKVDNVEVMGYDKIIWSMDINSLKETLNKNYSATLYDFYSIDNGDTIYYNFNMGKFKGFEVNKWEVKFVKSNLIGLKLFFEQTEHKDSLIKTFIKKDFDVKKDKFPLEKKLYNSKTEKPVTMLRLNKINQIFVLEINKID
jgi:hypothetical protein